MENKVGDKPFTGPKHAQLLAQLKSIVVELQAHGITLDSDGKRRLLRPRKGAEEQIRRVHELAVKHGVALRGFPRDGILADMALADQYLAFENELRTALAVAEDTGTQADSEAWEAFLAYYGVLGSMAERSPELATELASVVEFMSNGPRKKAPPQP